MEGKNEAQESSNDQLQQPIAHCSYTSRFFGNYLDNSLIDVSGSDLSLSKNEESTDPIDSAQQAKIEGLLKLGLTYKRKTLGMAIEIWQREKERIVRLQKRTPVYMAKLLLKICMFVNVKIKSKCHMFFSKIKKMAKNAANQPQTVKVKPPEPKIVDERKESKLRCFVSGYVKINEISQKIAKKYFERSLQRYAFFQLQQNLRKVEILTRGTQILQSQYEAVMGIGWSSIQLWLNYQQKLEILVDSLKLVVHQYLRAGILAIKLIQTAQKSNISNAQSRISSIRPQSSSQIITKIKQEGYQPFQPQAIKEQSTLQAKKPYIFKKQSESERQYTVTEASANDGKLKLHKNMSAPSEEYLSRREAELAFITNIQTYSVRSQDYGYLNENDVSIPKKLQTPQCSVISNRKESTVKKSAPIISPLLKTHKIFSALIDSDLTIKDTVSKGIFNNITQSIRSRPLKSDDLHHDLTDFNDLFFTREILNFYLVFEPPTDAHQHISINPNLYNVSQEEYSFLPSEKGSRTRMSRNVKQKTIASCNQLQYSETFIGAWNRLSLEERSAHRYSQYDEHPQTCHYLSPPQYPIRSKQLKIPCQIPKNYDYYANKSNKSGSSRKADKKSATKSDSSSFLYQKVKEVANSVAKARIFNIVKAGNSSRMGLRLGESIKKIEEAEKKSKKSVDRKKSRGKDQTNTSRRSKDLPRDLLRSPDEGSRQKCEYMMSFRGCPPKKRVRKQA